MSEFTKAEAERECIRRWRDLPRAERATIDQAAAFSAVLVKEVDFPTSRNRYLFIRGWLENEFSLRGTL